MSLVHLVFHKHQFSPNHTYFRFRGCGEIQSFNFLRDKNSGVSIPGIAVYIDKNEDALGNNKIQIILDEYKGE